MIKVARALYFTAVGLWVGGMATLAFVVAPTLFRTQSRVMAGQAFGAILHRFGPFQLALAAVSIVAVGLLARTGDLRPRAALIRVAVLLLMVILVCTSQFYVGPAIEKERDSGAVLEKTRFGELHRLSVILAGTTLFLGTGLLALSAATSKSSDGP
jgi:uncharacterized membrane protein